MYEFHSYIVLLCSINNLLLVDSLQPSITINTRKSFERVQTPTHQQERVHEAPPGLRDLPGTGSDLEEYCIIESSKHTNKGAPVNPMPQKPNDEDNPALKSEETDDLGQPYITKFSDNYLSDYCIVEKPSSRDLGVSLLDFFPVSHVILNNVDWSLTVVNIGLCVMIYSFQPSNPNTDIKVCIITYVHMYIGMLVVCMNAYYSKSFAELFEITRKSLSKYQSKHYHVITRYIRVITANSTIVFVWIQTPPLSPILFQMRKHKMLLKYNATDMLHFQKIQFSLHGQMIAVETNCQ